VNGAFAAGVSDGGGNTLGSTADSGGAAALAAIPRCTGLSSGGGGGTVTVGTGTLVGSIDCDETVIIGDLASGTPSEVVIKVVANITTAGAVDFNISGGGFSTVTSPYTVGTTTSGMQDFYIPVVYDGTAFSTVSFDFTGFAAGCSADLSGVTPVTTTTNTTVIPIGNLCTPVAGATLSKAAN